MKVTVWLRQQGFEKAQSMRGGTHAWWRHWLGKCWCIETSYWLLAFSQPGELGAKS